MTRAFLSIFVQRKVKNTNGPSIHQILLLKYKGDHHKFPRCWTSVLGTYPEDSNESPNDFAGDLISKFTGLQYKTDVTFVRDSTLPNEMGGGISTHIFLFRLIASKSVVLPPDSPFETYSWIAPFVLIGAVSDVLKSNEICVPGLAAQLSKVFLPSQIEDFVEWIGKKRTQGAAEIANLTLMRFEKLMQEMLTKTNNTFDNLPPRVLLNFLESVVEHIGNSRPSIAPLKNLALYLQNVIRKMPSDKDMLMIEQSPSLKANIKDDTELVKNHLLTRLLTAVSTYQLWRSDSFLRLVHHVHTLMNGINSFYTMSRSSVLETAMVDTAKLRASENRAPLQVTIAESRPLLEGILMASEVIQNSPSAGIKLTIVTDAQAVLFAQKCDCVLVGADAVFPDGSCVNKVGGLAAFYSAYNNYPVRKPVYVACTSDKFLSSEQLRHLRDLYLFRHTAATSSNENTVTTSSSSSPNTDTSPSGESDSSPTATEELRAFLETLRLSDQDHKGPLGFTLEEKEAEEVYSAETKPNNPISTILQADNAVVRNVYFEVIPAYLITAYVTEQGLVAPSDVTSVLTNRKKDMSA